MADALNHDGAPPDLELLHSDKFSDPFIELLAYRMLQEASSGSPHGALFVDQAALTLVAALFSNAGRLKKTQQEARPLPSEKLRKVKDVIADRLDEKITLEALAQETGLDVFRFTRAFRNASGQTPHQYVLSCRLEKAQRLLIESADPLAEIAFACGFSSQQHMTTVFSRKVGLTPAKFRKQRLL